jgi:DNA polymerase-3 subunit gamma/tau
VSHQVLSRKYRPQRFDELVGQEHVARILQNALASDRVGHAYLLVGPRGVGKTTTARIFARALNCAERPAAGEDAGAEAVEPCGRCASCEDIAAGSDLDVVEMDAASNNAVDDVRALREQVGYATVRSRYRIWIVDEVHMLSLPAFNAFLKTLEEPPPQVKFLFCTTEEHKLPATFRSRCQRIEFRRIGEAAMAARLEQLAARESVALEAGVASAIAHGALGGLRDAESQLEQLIAARQGTESVGVADLDALSGRAPAELLEKLCAAVDEGRAADALDAVDACLAAGSKPGVLVDQWLEHLRAQLVGAARAKPPAEGEPAPGPGLARLSRAVDVLLAKRGHLRAGAEGGLVLQVAAVELARLPDARDLDALIAALRGEGAPPPGDGPTPPAGPGGAPRSEAGGPPATRRPPSDDAAPPAAAPDAVALRARWDDVRRAARRRSEPLARALDAVHVDAVHDDTVVLVVDDADRGARPTLMRKEIQLAFGQVVREVTGSYLLPAVVDAPPPAAEPAPDGRDLRAHPAVQLVTETTSGHLVHVERAQSRDAPEEGPRRGSEDA